MQKVVRKELGKIIRQLAGNGPEHSGEALHAARKGLKKVRAVLRLLREPLSQRIFRRENSRLREAARALSPRRDAEVLAKTLARFQHSHGRTVGKEAVVKLNRLGLQNCRRAFEVHMDARDPQALLAAVHRRVKRWPLGKLGWPDLCRGLEHSYRRSRKALRTSAHTRADADLHEWRKRVKDLWYELRVVFPHCSGDLKCMTKKLQLLGDQLGDDHDLVMLAAAADSAGLSPQQFQSVHDWIAAHRSRLQVAAFGLGRHVFAEKPARFGRLLCRAGKRCRSL